MARKVAATLALLIVFAPGAAGAEDFNGKTAAYIDWAVKNCDCKSTDKEHQLVETANGTAKAHDAFQHSYVEYFQSKELTEALANTRARDDKCEALKGWFGPSGSRIAGLVTWAKAPAAFSSGSGPSSSPSGGGGRRGRHPPQ